MTFPSQRSTQERVMVILAREPGASVSRIADRIGVDHSTAAYHLNRLERKGLVQARVVGRDRCHFLEGTGHCRHQQGIVPFLQRPGARAFLTALLATGASDGLRAVDLVRATELSLSRVRWFLYLAQRLGCAERTRYGRYRVSPGAEACARKALAGEACRPVPGSPCHPREDPRQRARRPLLPGL